MNAVVASSTFPASVPGQATHDPAGASHVVERGETLWAIARAHGVSVQALLDANPSVLNPDIIYPGQQIVVPGMGGQGSAPAQAATPASATSAAPEAAYSGGNLTRVQLAQVFHDAGFRGEDLVAMVAIAMRESGGDPHAYNGDRGTGDDSYGLTQINMLGNLGPWIRDRFGLTSNQQLWDPATNARVAFGLAYMVEGKPLFPWGPYRGDSPTHNTDVGAARAAVEQAQAQGLLGRPFDGGTGANAPSDTPMDAPAATPSASAGAPSAQTASMPTLRIGARGEAVADLQRRLQAAGFSPGPVDGWFGPQTQAAVRSFQSSRGITVDGWVGPQTWGQLLQGSGQAPARSDGRVAIGASGDAVREVQTRLRDAGYYHANIGGNFGPQTDAALRAFQRDHGLVVDGWAGPQTLAALRAGNNGGGTPAAPPPANGGNTGQPNTATTAAAGVTPVTSGPRDARIQAALAYAQYWATQNTAYVGGASEYRFGGIGDGGTDKQGNQKRYLAPRGVVGFDCSGLVVAMYRQAGIDLAARGIASTVTMASGLDHVPLDQLQPGDLLVKSGSHVVIYLGDVTGDGRPDVVEATPYGPNPGDGSAQVGGVRINDAASFMGNGYVGRRVPPAWLS